jgi:hypothetical protein
MVLFELEGVDSTVSWCLFNSVWERHEYPEHHRAVLLAEEELAADPALAKELVGVTDGEERLRRILDKSYPELFRRIGWIPVLKRLLSSTDDVPIKEGIARGATGYHLTG